MEASSNDVVFERSPKGQVRRPTRPEHVIAFEFLKIHYEEDVRAETPVQKSDVYTDYERHCQVNSYKPLVAADFGRILKSMFPNARDRRLGSRGSSKYCYVGVKRKSENSSKNSSLNPYSAEDLSNAYQAVVCEWASTVLSRRMQNLNDLAKYLLKHRFVQTRSCAALTITASLKDTDELTEVQPMNKHRETQLKLQEKLREKLLNKQSVSFRAGSVDDSELQLAERSEGAFGRNQSACSTPDSEGQLRQVAMQTSSAPGSRRTSPEHTAMSVTNSACTSPALVDLSSHKLLHHLNSVRNGYDTSSANEASASITGVLSPINSQCNSVVGSPVAPSYNSTLMCHSINTQPHYQHYDPRIHSCPNTPLLNYQHQQRFDFQSQQTMGNNPAQQQCMSLPNSTRNTPVIPEFQDANDAGFYSNLQRPLTTEEIFQPSMTPQQSFSQSYPNFQRLDFTRNNNSAFIPIKDGGMTLQGNVPSHLENAYSEGQTYNNCQNKSAEFNAADTDLQRHSDSVELEINELFNIIENNEEINQSDTLPPQHPHLPNSSDIGGIERLRPLSAQGAITHNSSQRLSHAQPPPLTSTSGSVIYDLLKAGTNHNGDSRHISQRYRHHSGPQLGHNFSHKSKHSHKAAAKPMITTPAAHTVTNGAVDPFNSPPSTPNGNFRPVHTPSRELRMYYDPQQNVANLSVKPTNQPPANIALPARFNNSLVGTMSPPAQPLTKRKRNHSGGKVSCGSALPTLTHTTTSAATAPPNAVGQEHSDFVARRNLGNQLSSPVGSEELRQNISFGGPIKNNGYATSSSSFHEGVAKPTANRSSGIDQR